MSKLVWKYDLETKELIGNGVEVADDYSLKDGETFATPEEGLFPPITFNGTEWEGVTYEEWLKANPIVVKPTEVQKIVIQQAKTIVQMQSVLIQQSKDIAALKGVNK
ncbi:hypothetical protein [Pediococcus acidilactici]|uniref:hypothetical protein n=1 Tax=Pediococcus acidilactici TaxID=1254 RepID=UPI0020CBD348|nr:hypothetical protein [Pediococcus acidilactici]MCQ0055474.1 hypothetical protein [Pediococcus acidilactici]MCQ0078103.1 hypothetical protein [Pediococcus acidilactici]